jgi:hypothetical protein
LLSFEDSGSTHACTNAHGDDTVLLVGALKLVEEGDDLTGSSAAKRVAKGDGATAGVELLLGNAELLNAVHGLGGESLVHFKHIDILDGNTSLLESGRDGNGGADTHDLRRAASNSEANDAALNLEAELLGNISASEEHSSGTVSDLAGVTSGHGATFLSESGLELAQRGKSGVLAHTVVLIDNDLGLIAILVLDD